VEWSADISLTRCSGCGNRLDTEPSRWRLVQERDFERRLSSQELLERSLLIWRCSHCERLYLEDPGSGDGVLLWEYYPAYFGIEANDPVLFAKVAKANPSPLAKKRRPQRRLDTPTT
jgi:hypothetical protein